MWGNKFLLSFSETTVIIHTTIWGCFSSGFKQVSSKCDILINTEVMRRRCRWMIGCTKHQKQRFFCVVLCVFVPIYFILVFWSDALSAGQHNLSVNLNMRHFGKLTVNWRQLILMLFLGGQSRVIIGCRAHNVHIFQIQNVVQTCSSSELCLESGTKREERNCQFKMKNLDNNKSNANVSKRPLCTFSCLVSCLRLHSSFTGCK